MKFDSYASNQIYKYAKHYGIKAIPLSYKDNLIELTYKGKKEFIKQTATRFTTIIQGRICDNKFLANQHLKSNGIDNVPHSIVIEQWEELRGKKIHYPVVVKPLKGHGGKGISIGIKNKKDLQSAFRIAKKHYFRVLVEQQFFGDDYRFLVVNKSVFVAKRSPAHIIGDGKSNILNLIEKENAKRRKARNKILVPIKISKETIKLLGKQSYTLTSIPGKGVIVYLKQNANLSTGGTAIDYTSQTHGANMDLALKVAKVMNMKIIAVDFLFKDVSKPYSENNGIIIEINDTPGIRLHHPKEQEIIHEIFTLLFPSLN